MMRFLACCVLALFTCVDAKTIEVKPSGVYSTLTSALLAAKDRDTILIFPGTYREEDITISRQINVIGIGLPVLDAGGKSKLLTITASNVLIKGLRLINTPVNYLIENAAIKIDKADSCVITGNSFENNFFAVYVGASKHCIIENNRIKSNGRSEANSGNGIHLWKCESVTITGNRIEGHRDGIYLEFAGHCVIRGNYSTNNRRYGMHFMFSNDCTYEQNTFSHNSAGVAVMFTRRVEMNNNRFENNWGTGSYGILLKEIYESRIRNNRFVNNSVGMYCEGSNKIVIEHNLFEKNGWAVRLMANSMDNTFSKNNFVANTFEIATNSSRNYNTFSGNYWSRYKGYDLNRDGIGDVPHHPVTLFSALIEKNPTALLLLHSFLIDILDASEKVFPSLTPEALTDNTPRMRLVN